MNDSTSSSMVSLMKRILPELKVISAAVMLQTDHRQQSVVRTHERHPRRRTTYRTPKLGFEPRMPYGNGSLDTLADVSRPSQYRVMGLGHYVGGVI